MTGPNNIKHPAPESGATVEPTDDLRQAVRNAIYGANGPGKLIADLEPFYVEWLGKQADAAIAAYRNHPDGAAKDRTAAEAERDKWQQVAAFKANRLFRPWDETDNPQPHIAFDHPIRACGANAADLFYRGSNQSRAAFNHGVKWAAMNLLHDVEKADAEREEVRNTAILALQTVIGCLEDPTGGQYASDMRAASTVAFNAIRALTPPPGDKS